MPQNRKVCFHDSSNFSARRNRRTQARNPTDLVPNVPHLLAFNKELAGDREGLIQKIALRVI